MFPLTRILGLAAAGAVIALAAAASPVSADPSTQNTAAHAQLTPQEINECSLHRRAISRHACHARLARAVHVDTAENK
jgi:hypothetical protein